MSAVFGIFNFSGEPVSQENMNIMKQSMLGVNYGHSGFWNESLIGLGNLLLYNTPESLYESLPLHDKASGHTLAWAGRLDNRSELFQKFNIPKSEQAKLPDSKLVLMAYQKWGESCPEHLLGDWAFALWNAKQQKLFLARDHYGVTGLYYYYDQHRFIFSSSLQGILALPSIHRRLNPVAISGMGLCSYTLTHYKGIYLLTPAQALTIMKESSTPKLWSYWCPTAVPPICLHSDQDYLDAFMEIYKEAVRCRLRGNDRIGMSLSGGLDSGSISVLASHELAQQGRELSAFSSIPTYETRLTTPAYRCADERPYVEATCRFGKNIQLTYIKDERITPIEAIRRSVDIMESPNVNFNYIWLLEMHEIAQQQNINTMLDGWGGNFTISWVGDRRKYLRTLVENKEWKTLIQEFNKRQGMQQNTFFRAQARQMLSLFTPPAWKESFRKFRNRNQRKFINPITRQNFRRNHKDWYVDTEVENSSNLGLYLNFRNGKAGALGFALSSAFGIESRQPAMDKRLIEFCLGIPSNQHTRNGQDRLLIRNAMSGLMPDSVLWYKQRGLQSADFGPRLRVHRDEIEATLQELRMSNIAQHYLDLPYMTKLFHNINNKLDLTTQGAANTLFRGLALGIFLQRF